jgi:hypothetical protein
LAIIAAPAIIRPGILMPVKLLTPLDTDTLRLEDLERALAWLRGENENDAWQAFRAPRIYTQMLPNLQRMWIGPEQNEAIAFDDARYRFDFHV